MNRLVEHDAVAIYLVQEDKLIPRYVKGESFRLFSSLEIPVGQGLSGWVAENDLPILNGNPAVEPGYLNDPQTGYAAAFGGFSSAKIQGADCRRSYVV